MVRDFEIVETTKKTTNLAERIATEYLHNTYDATHLLWAVVDEDVGLYPLLDKLQVDSTTIRKWALNLISNRPKDIGYVDTPKPNISAKAVWQECEKLCLRYGTPEITPLEILEALCTPNVGFDTKALRRLPIALYEIIELRNSEVSVILNNTNENVIDQIKKGSYSQQLLDKYCENLNQLAADGKIDPVIGRDKELKQLMEILGKRLSPNVLIVGEPGVGKTAIVGGLALKILGEKIPESLKTAAIFSLDVSGRLVAGAFKGEVEERLKSILKSIAEFEYKAILFIDEIHILLDEKGPVGSGVVNLLKPELARGAITLIGATTQTEYQKYIEKDAAFNRRFTKLLIAEPDEITAGKMLEGLAAKYETFHQLKIKRESLTKAVFLAKKYIHNKHLPASAIELMDFTMACAVQMNATSREIIEDIEKAWNNERFPDFENYKRLIKNQLSELLIGKLGEDFENGSLNFTEIIQQLKDWTKTKKNLIEIEDIEAITAYLSGIPMGKLQAKEQERLQHIPAILQRRVVGQDYVIAAVAQGLKTFRANLKEPKEPGAIFFFTGPTGTGKTELAKAIAELLFDDEDALIRFDMSEFQESHSVATLLGAPPGYVGYDEGGILVNNVRKKPYSVVLFDEIEKAHPDIYGIFLQMLTDGRLQDKQGKLANFSDTIIIFTSNAGAEQIIEKFNAGKVPNSEELKTILRETRHFKDEFLGRVDSQILPFAPISEEVALLILEIHLKKFQKLLKRQHQIELNISEGIKEHLIDIGFSPLYGARPLRNAIKSFLTPPIADKIIMGEIKSGDKIDLDIGVGEELIWKVREKE